MAEKISLYLLFCVMGSVTNLPLQLSLPGLKDFDTNTLNMIKEIAHSNPEDKDAGEPEGTFSRIIQANKGNKMAVHEADMFIKTGRSAKSCTDCRWPKSADGIIPVPYTLSSAYSANDINLFNSSMQEIETLTCVRFIPRTTEDDFLNIVSSQGCASYVGRVGGGQMVAVDIGGCMYRGIIQHELNHALGFYHEHMRSDRDNYVDIMFQYISPDDVINFVKKDTNNLGLEYDYGSVMHYNRYAFSNNSSQPTIVPKPDPNVPIGQRDGLSILDISKINRLYQCNVCANLLNNKNGTVNSANYPSAYPNDFNCLWLIRAPSGQVTLNFNGFDVQSSPDCVSDYIKIYDGPSKTSPVLLDKTCGTALIPPLIASTSQILVEFVSDSSVTGVGFKATYGSVQCGGVFYAFQGNVTSPGYPVAYGPNMDCIFTITAPAGHRISLTIRDFQLESAPFCRYDYLKIEYGTILKGPFCYGFPTSPIISTGNSLKLIFHSDQSNQMRGFQASYTFI